MKMLKKISCFELAYQIMRGGGGDNKAHQFDFVIPRATATGCRPIYPGLVICRQQIKLIEVICGNYLNAINNGSACSVLFLNTPRLFPIS